MESASQISSKSLSELTFPSGSSPALIFYELFRIGPIRIRWRCIVDQHQTKDWRELCKAAANESDPNKLMALIAELTKALEERDGRRNATRRNDNNSDANLSVLSGAA